MFDLEKEKRDLEKMKKQYQRMEEESANLEKIDPENQRLKDFRTLDLEHIRRGIEEYKTMLADYEINSQKRKKSFLVFAASMYGIFAAGIAAAAMLIF